MARRPKSLAGNQEVTLHTFVTALVHSKTFDRMIIALILLNMVAIALESFVVIQRKHNAVFEAIDIVFVCAYTVEFSLKLYSSPLQYWDSRYNQFDAFILFTSYLQFFQANFSSLRMFDNITFLRILRALRALRALRGIGIIRSLQIIVRAFKNTLGEVLNIVVLLFLFMYIFAIMGYYFFAGDANNKSQNWESLDKGFMSLFVYVTADGWSDLQAELDEGGHIGSRLFSASFLFVGHFIFINLFIGVVIQNIEAASEDEKKSQEEMKASHFHTKKRQALAEQKKNLSLEDRDDSKDINTAHHGNTSTDTATDNAQEHTQEETVADISDEEAAAESYAAGIMPNIDNIVLPEEIITNSCWIETYDLLLRKHGTIISERQQIQLRMVQNQLDRLETTVTAGTSASVKEGFLPKQDDSLSPALIPKPPSGAKSEHLRSNHTSIQARRRPRATLQTRLRRAQQEEEERTTSPHDRSRLKM